ERLGGLDGRLAKDATGAQHRRRGAERKGDVGGEPPRGRTRSVTSVEVADDRGGLVHGDPVFEVFEVREPQAPAIALHFGPKSSPTLGAREHEHAEIEGGQGLADAATERARFELVEVERLAWT